MTPSSKIWTSSLSRLRPLNNPPPLLLLLLLLLFRLLLEVAVVGYRLFTIFVSIADTIDGACPCPDCDCDCNMMARHKLRMCYNCVSVGYDPSMTLSVVIPLFDIIPVISISPDGYLVSQWCRLLCEQLELI